MKVRHKHYGGVWEVIDEGKTFYTVCVPRYNPQIVNCGSPFAASKAEYEPVPEPDRWEDVTGACGFQEGSPREVRFFQHRVGTPDCNTLFEWPYLATIEGYRLRKVLVPYTPARLDDDKFAWRVAFIVERKVSP